jgi:hypothetical protein
MNPSGISRSTDVSSRLAQSLLAGLILVLDGLPAIGFEGESGTPKAPGQVEVGPVAPEENVRRQGDFENTLGMRFVPVKVGSETVHFSIWETRVRDYQAYANSATGVDASWRSATFKRKMVTPFDTCPVMNVSWNDAQKFAIWLTEKERREGRISASARYRLPTDTEWSWAVGIGDREGSGSPKNKDMRLKDVYPWGTQFPPPARAGNYSDRTAKAVLSDVMLIDGYEDGHATAAPVGTFPASPSGLHDLGGNVWEWCEDFYDGQSGFRVLRGGSWGDSEPTHLLSSRRVNASADYRLSNLGFRLVLVGVAVR